MCIMTGNTTFVGGTRIFCRFGRGNRQYLAYAMSVAATEPTAMVLPLPVEPGSSEKALKFIDLSGYPAFFDHMHLGFPPPPVMRSAPAPASLAIGGSAPQPLVVHDVGAFEASFVPTLDDFSRLDPRFVLPSEVWDQLPDYADYGFAVFKLKLEGGATKKIHPMAFQFPSRHSDRLFFPTVHVHDRRVHEFGNFDHVLYCQGRSSFFGSPKPIDDPLLIRSMDIAKSFMSMDQAKGLLDAKQHCYKQTLLGVLPNKDQWVSI